MEKTTIPKIATITEIGLRSADEIIAYFTLIGYHVVTFFES